MVVKRSILMTVWSSLGVLFCIAILMLSVPRLMSSVYNLYPETLLTQTKTINDELYRDAIKELDTALIWHIDSNYWQNKALCYLKLYYSQTTSTEEKTEALKQAQMALEKGLSESPVNPFAWYRLALARDLKTETIQPVQSAFKLSLYTGRVEPELLIPRLNFGFNHIKELDYETKELWLKQIPVAFQLQPTKLVNLVVNNPTLKTYVLAVFLFQKEKLIQFNKAFESTYQQALKASH